MSNLELCIRHIVESAFKHVEKIYNSGIQIGRILLKIVLNLLELKSNYTCSKEALEL